MSRPVRLLLIVAAFAVVPPVLGRTGMLSSAHALVLAAGVCYAIGAISLNVLMGYAGQLSLGHAAFLGVGAFATALITGTGPQWPFLTGVVVAAIAGGAFAFVLGLPALRLRGLYLAITTIAFGFMMELSLFRWSAITGGSAGLSMPRPFIKSDLIRFQFRENADYLALVLLILVLVWLLDANVVRTKLGRAFQGIRSDESVAMSFGVDVARYKLLAFVIAGALAGVAGALFGHLNRFVGEQSFRFDISLLLVVMVVVGGLGSRGGVTAAAIMFAVLPGILDVLDGWQYVIGPLLLIDVVTRHPGGFAQAVREARHKRAVKAAREGAGREDPRDQPMPKLPALPRPDGLPPRELVAPGAPLLSVHDVSIRFGGLQALDKVSLTVPQGKIVGLIGPNGAGKTTLFNIASGHLRADEGRVMFAGRDITALPPHARAAVGMGRTFQLIGLAKNLSVLENFLLAQHQLARYSVGEALLHFGRTRETEKALRERAHAAIAALGFERYTDTPVSNLSHGQQRIVEIGCVLVTSPELVMLDEPSAGMAPAAVENLAQRLREMRDELGRTVLLIEHNIPLVLDVCDEIYVLNFGQLLAHGTTEEIAQRPEVLAAYFGEAATPVEAVTTA